MFLDDFAKLFDAQVGVVGVGAGGQVRAVELQDESSIDDRLVLMAHDIGDRLHVGLFVGIVFVAKKAHETAGRKGRHEDVLGLGRFDCRG